MNKKTFLEQFLGFVGQNKAFAPIIAVVVISVLGAVILSLALYFYNPSYVGTPQSADFTIKIKAEAHSIVDATGPSNKIVTSDDETLVVVDNKVEVKNVATIDPEEDVDASVMTHGGKDGDGLSFTDIVGLTLEQFDYLTEKLHENVTLWQLKNSQSHLEVVVKKGDTLEKIFDRLNIDRGQTTEVVRSLKGHYNIKRGLKSGQKIFVDLDKKDEDADLKQMVIPLSFDKDVVVAKDKNGFEAKIKQRKIVENIVLKEFSIESSIYVDGSRHNVSQSVLSNAVKQLSYAVDFQRDIRKGDKLTLIYELDLDPIRSKQKSGKLLYACLENRRGKHEVFAYSLNKRTVYLDGRGRMSQKRLLRTPVDAVRISSHFGYRRHPILGYTKMHTGVDFAAPTGTPIYAAGDGVVEFVGWKGGYGRYIRIKHDKTFKTAYAHLYRYRKGLKRGQRVKQGEVIGYVGSSGRSTGPHLHYEVHKNGKKVNPLKVTLPKSKGLDKKEVSKFKAVKAKYMRLYSILKDDDDQMIIAKESQK